MVQFSEANRIEQAWIDRGRPYCDHPDVDKEYGLGMDSGDRRCLNCGDTFTRSEWKSDKLEPRGEKPGEDQSDDDAGEAEQLTPA